MKVISIFSGVILLCTSCQNKTERVDDSAIRYKYFNLEETGWKSKEHIQEVDDIDFKATEVPISYYILKSEGKENLFAIDSIEKANKNERVLEFIFAQDEQKNLLKEEYTNLGFEEIVQYMSFSIADDFYVVTTKNDTVNCSGAIYERNFNISTHQKVILFFSGVDQNDKLQLVYNDRLFKKGTLKFKFEENTTKLSL